MYVNHICYTAVFTLAMCVLQQGTTSTTDCKPFGTPVSSQCIPAHQRDSQFTELDGQLHKAHTYEDLPDFVLDTTIGMYLYLHPCLQYLDAAVVLFFVQDTSDNSTHNSLAHLVGRRKRDSFMTDNDLLRQQLKYLVQSTNAGCVQFLIEKYKNISAIAFKLKYPDFHTTSTTTTTITTTPATVTTPTTTVSVSTPVTTPTITTAVTTQTMAPSSTSSTTETTSLVPPVTYGPISCTSCSGLLCLLGNHLTKCPDGLFFCQTTIEEADTGRQLTRGCSSQTLCDSFAQHQNSSLCSQADHQILPVGVTCRFCCLGDDCNKPPHVIPAPDTLYPPTVSA